MILTCASCATRYYADDALIGPNGRSVRCASCGHTWFAEPQLVLEEAGRPRRPALTREQVERMRRQAAPEAGSSAARFRQQQAERARRERMRAVVVAWGASGAAVAATAAGAVVLRQDVAEMWPQSAGAYSAVGLDVNVYGVEIYDLAVARDFEGPTPVLVVSGEVRNIGRDERPAPPVRLTLRDAAAASVYEVVHTIPVASIAAGGAAAFNVRLANPPVDAVDLEASFLSPAEAAGMALTDAPVGDAPLELGPENVAPAALEPEIDHGEDPAVGEGHDAAAGPHALNLRMRMMDTAFDSPIATADRMG